MEGQERSASPAWTPHHHPTSHDTHSRYCPHFHEPRAPLDLRFFARRSSSDVSRRTPAERLAASGRALPDSERLQLPRLEGMPQESTPRRFAGDGYDYRRPVGFRQQRGEASMDLSADDDDDDTHMDLSGQEADVIDLTEEDDSGYGPSQDNAGNYNYNNNNYNNNSNNNNNNREDMQRSTRNPRTHRAPRLPRGMHAIIDLESGHEEWRAETPPAAEPGSPDLEFVSSRPISPQRRRARSNSDEDEVEFVRSQALPEAERQRRRDRDVDRALDLMGEMNGRFTHLRAQVERFNAQVNHTAARLRHTPVPPPRGAPRARGMVHVGFAAPGLLDFDLVGFDMGIEPTRAPVPPPAAYKAPDKAPEGFTRSPEEQGELVCPNCEEELCVGGDDVKRQVWIVKTCGHVYCGECTANRSVKRSSKGKEKPARTKPFKECVVEECGKKVTNAKSMFQIFL
ncbi:hypothetical protein CC86DRAFT_370594 [Ophiobolus disseminans]|uniref:Uncharacterized protein n=1 Tax=Ophiobolus disseminans TaxID=1469910 RepID=A0A6A6ZYQ5_9PLEO|nr:hypothetical protein CC86DRAFT_370594 [Ophiobolus disseminans]